MKNILVFFFLLLMGCAQAQIPDHFSRNDSTWYNRKIGVTKYLLHILEGNPQKAIDQANAVGYDVEADFVRAIAYAHQNKADSAFHYLNASLEKDIDFNRYLAGGLQLLEPLQKFSGFELFAKKYSSPLVHGPMLGALTESAVGIWLRTQHASAVEIHISTQKSFSSPIRLKGNTKKATEFSINLHTNQLMPNQNYYYKIFLDGKTTQKIYRFHTPLTTGSKNQLRVAFGGCAGYIPWHNHMWSTINAQNPDALLMLGDNVYIDYPLYPQLQQYCYYVRQSEPHFRNLTQQVPVYAIWDDHDFGDNDDYGTPALDTPAWKVKSLEVFKNQWVNPGYGNQGKMPGVYFNHTIGDVEFIFLDCRYYRQPSEVGAETAMLSMLGQSQKAWLKKTLKSSKARFKVLISSVPWAPGAKPSMEGRIDTWDGYPEEREEIFSFLEKQEVSGVILLSADRHRSDIWKIERKKGYPLFEFESGRLTNTHYHKKMPGAFYSYNEKPSFGILEFNTLAKRPYVSYQIINIDNVIVNTHQVFLDELN